MDKHPFIELQNDIIKLVEYGWSLEPQPLLPEYEGTPAEEWEAKHFGVLTKTDIHGVEHWEWPTFVRGKHLTWQQAKVMYYINQSKLGGLMKIAIAAGRGVGKTFLESVVIHWALIQCRDAQGAATSYSRELLYDILWKELAKTHRKARPEFKSLFHWSATRFSIAESPETWFISSKTGKKENPEALAGMHGDFVLIMADEGSGVPNEIFETALDGLTEENYLVFIASNWRRLTGFFNDVCKGSDEFVVLQFNSLHSPLYDVQKAIDIAKSDGTESDRYKVEVLGLSPDADSVDDKGYVPLLSKSDLRITTTTQFSDVRRIGLDPSGGGQDEAVWVLRDNFRAKVIGRLMMTGMTPSQAEKLMGETTLTFLKEYDVPIYELFIDNFGIGANVAMEVLNGYRGDGKPKGINVGEPADKPDEFINKRAEASWRLREWLRSGGELVEDPDDGWSENLTIRYKHNLKGRVQIMSKEMMKKEGYKSPNTFDALMLTFVKAKLKDTQTSNRNADKAFKQRLARQATKSHNKISNYN